MSLQSRSVRLALVLTSIITVSVPPSPIHAQRPDGLKIVVIQGEDAVNIIQQKTAVNPIVEVRDRNDLPVSGVAVTFSVGGQGATFAGGSSTLTLTTNAAGRAVASGLTPTAPGAVTINATAVVNGQTIATTITQTNFATAQAAAQAAASAGVSTSGASTTGATVAGGGGGLSGTMIGIIGGIGAAGAVAATSLGNSDPSTTSTTSTPSQPTGTTPTGTTPTPTIPAPASNRAPTIDSASITPNVALAGVDTPITLQVQASDADNDTLTYHWEFPDGSTSDQRALTRIFREGGLHTIRINVRDGTTTTSLELTLTMKTMTGSWDFRPTTPIPTFSDTIKFVLSQSGSSLSGTWTQSGGFNSSCPLTGSVRPNAPQIILDHPNCPGFSPVHGPGTSVAAHIELQMGSDTDTFNGVLTTPSLGASGFWTMRRER